MQDEKLILDFEIKNIITSILPLLEYMSVHKIS